ncbi:MAG: hypothetical protein HFH85_11600 [Lachnospiraceae bacterium]|nr:hypothetical protein [Lachnospiraceae bacterium]
MEAGQYFIINRARQYGKTMRLYNLFWRKGDAKESEIYKMVVKGRHQFILNGRLNMRLVLEKFVVHFDELYGDGDETFPGKMGGGSMMTDCHMMKNKAYFKALYMHVL